MQSHPEPPSGRLPLPQAHAGLLILLVTRASRVLVTTLATGALICALSVLPLLQLGSAWLTSPRANLNYSFADGTASLFHSWIILIIAILLVPATQQFLSENPQP